MVVSKYLYTIFCQIKIHVLCPTPLSKSGSVWYGRPKLVKFREIGTTKNQISNEKKIIYQVSDVWGGDVLFYGKC